MSEGERDRTLCSTIQSHDEIKTTQRVTEVHTHAHTNSRNTQTLFERGGGDKGYPMLERESLGNNQQTNH